MFWNDIKDIKDQLAKLTDHVALIERGLIEIKNLDGLGCNSICEKMSDLQTAFDDMFDSTDEYSSINWLHTKLNTLVDDKKRKEAVELATVTLDKFDDYMKNVDRLNQMINEFKGCVTLARGALEERKQIDKQTDETKKLAYLSQEIYKSMLSFIKAGENIKHEAHFKIDAIYKAVCEKEEKKSPKKRKSSNKNTTSASGSQ